MHPEALNEKGSEVFARLKEFPGFYLAGGTALALQIGHRVSVDFDLFSRKEIRPDLLNKVGKVFNGEVRPSVNNHNELTIFVDGVKVTFLHYPFPVVRKLTFFQDIELLGVKEIAATKAYTIGRRGTMKDYIDLYFIYEDGHTDINETMAIAREKYGGEFNARLFAEQLLYMDDIDDVDIVYLQKSINRQTITDYFYEAVSGLKI